MSLKQVNATLPSNLLDRAVRMGARDGLLHRQFARIRDLVGALLALAVLAPLLLLLSAAARASTGSSALFRQVRVGMKGRPFVVNKFRTLRPEAPSEVSKREAEHLATPVGQLMRRFKLDELPQLWNVVKGDMSLVGPRPIIPGEYRDKSHYQRLTVRPGLTGLWQLSRVREEPFDRNPEYDLFYVANMSLSFDSWLIWRTILLLLTKRETKIRLAARLWERNPSWRQLVPDRARAIPHRKGPLRSKLWVGGLFAAPLVLASPGVALALTARGDLLEARTAMLHARAAIRRLEPAAASSALDRAGNSFDDAYQKLSSWPTLGARAIPGLNQNLQVPRTLARAGADLVAAGREALNLVGTLPLSGGHLTVPFKDGVVDLAPFAEAAGPAQRMKSHLVNAERRTARTPGYLLMPSVAKSRKEVIGVLTQLRRQAEAVAGAALLVPKMLGAEEPRTWVIGAENSAELRGRGGYLGSFGLLKAEGGRLHLDDFRALPNLPLEPQIAVDGHPAAREYRRQYLELGGLATSQNLLMSPDFPLGASMLLSHLEQAAGINADGLISLDPTALSYLLRVTGPVQVEGIPEPLTSQNIIDWSLNRIYLMYQQDYLERREQLSQITAAVWNRFFSAKAINSRAASEALRRAVSERHLVVYSSDPDEQALIEALGMSGQVEETEGDYLLLTSQNTGENKLDYYKSRKMTYTGRLRPDGTLDAQIQVAVANTATPGTSFPDYVGGHRERIGLAAGRSRDFLSVFVPARARLQVVLKDGTPTSDFDNSSELGKRRLAAYVELGAGESQTVTFRYRLPQALVKGQYKLMIQNQATVIPDSLSVQIQLPPGASIEHRSGFRRGNKLSWDGTVGAVQQLSADISSPLTTRTAMWLTSVLQRPVPGVGRLPSP